MPRYYFTGQGREAVLADYKHDGRLSEFSFGVDLNNPDMTVKTAEGALIFIDVASKFAINKLHVGMKMKTPHAENDRLMGEGPRVDLHDLDINYASGRLEELISWRKPEYRENVRNVYFREIDRYYARPRLRQLAIPNEQLEARIRELEDKIEILSGRDDREFISSEVIELEGGFEALQTGIKGSIEEYPAPSTRKSRNAKKVIRQQQVVGFSQHVYDKLKGLLAHINDRVNMHSAWTYWDDVGRWGVYGNGKYIFIGCIPGAKEHIERHTKRQIVGAGFFGDFVPRIFPSTLDFMYYAIKQVKDLKYGGGTLLHQVKSPENIGFNEVVALKDLPKNVRVRRGTRGEKERHVVNIVSGVEKTKTNNIVVVVAPGFRNEYGIHTIYCGTPSPNFDDADFWSRHAFIE